MSDPGSSIVKKEGDVDGISEQLRFATYLRFNINNSGRVAYVIIQMPTI